VSGIISLGAVFGMMTVILVMIYGGTRLLYALGRDGLLPKVMQELNPKHQTPVKNTWFFGILIAICAGLVPLGKLAELVNMGTLIAFMVVSIGVIFLRKNKQIPSDGFKVPLYPVIPILSFLACLFLISQLSVDTWIACGLWFIVGMVFYFLYGRTHSTMNE
ncbi:amino acid permease, partial [Butyricicoccus sp. 1XD8-22]